MKTMQAKLKLAYYVSFKMIKDEQVFLESEIIESNEPINKTKQIKDMAMALCEARKADSIQIIAWTEVQVEQKIIQPTAAEKAAIN